MSSKPNQRSFQVSPGDVIRQIVRAHEREHGYFNVVDNMVEKLENEIRIWYEFERRHEASGCILDIPVNEMDDDLGVPPDIAKISPLGGRVIVEADVPPATTPIAVTLPPWNEEEDNEPDEGI